MGGRDHSDSDGWVQTTCPSKPPPRRPLLPQFPGFAMPPAKPQPGSALQLDTSRLVAALRGEALRLGFSRVGIAPALAPPPNHQAYQGWLAAGLAGVMQPWLDRHEPLRASLEAILPAARSVVMLATDHAIGRGAEAEPVAAGRGRVARYARGDDYHDLLRGRLNALAAWLEAAAPGSRARGVVDSAPLAERDYGQAAGLGWFGKNTMLIDPRAGSYFLLSALVTDLPLPADAPLEIDHCGTCTACLEACPTAAFPQPRVLDANKCISAVTIEDHEALSPALREGMGDWIFGCDICQEVCPWNRHAPGSTEPAFQSREGDGSLELADLLALDEAGFRNAFRGSPVLRAKRRGLLRSAAIALGNRPHEPAFGALAAALDDDEQVIRGAAAWAFGRWIAAGVMVAEARAAVESRLAIEQDAVVRGELAAALSPLDPE
jgi:epoxyqueuosine reductase